MAWNVSSRGTWLAELCARKGIPCGLGPALSRTALHGGHAKHARIEAQKIAVLLRGGMLPQASVYPSELRASRDLLRRRIHFMRQRAEFLTPVQPPNSPSTRPEIGKQIASQANRDGVAERFPTPAVPKRIAVDLALMRPYDHLLRAMALAVLTTAKPHDAHTRYLLRTVAGLGAILSLVRLDAIQPSERFPRVQAFGSYCRLGKGAKEAAGQRSGTLGTTIAKASLTWAFSEAAVLGLRHTPAGQNYLARLEKKRGQGQAWTVLAPKLARAVYDMLKRGVGFDRNAFLQGSGRGGGEPAASLGHAGLAEPPGAASIHPGRRRTPVST